MPQLATHTLDGSGADIDVPGRAASNPSEVSETTNLLTDFPSRQEKTKRLHAARMPQFTRHVHSRNSRAKGLLGTWHLMGGTESCCDAIGIQVGRQPQSAWPNHQLHGSSFLWFRLRNRTPGPPHLAARDRNQASRQPLRCHRSPRPSWSGQYAASGVCPQHRPIEIIEYFGFVLPKVCHLCNHKFIK
jgi:hypothetical protein